MHRAGVSSFAYQGTNSHVIADAPVAHAVPQQQAMAWQRARFWYQVQIALSVYMSPYLLLPVLLMCLVFDKTQQAGWLSLDTQPLLPGSFLSHR